VGSVKSDHAAQKWSEVPEFMGGVHLTEEAGGKGEGSRGSKLFPCVVEHSGTWVSSPVTFDKLRASLLGRLSWGGVQALFQLPPCPSLPAPLPPAVTLNHSTLRTTPIQLLPRSLQEASQDTDARLARGSGIVSDGA